MVLHIATVWFNNKVGWIGTDYFKCFSVFNSISLFFIIVTTIVKLIVHVNGVLFIESTLQMSENGDVLNNGLIWNVQDHDGLNLFIQLVDFVWLFFILISPILQGGYLVYRGNDTHGLILTIEDNRESRNDYIPIETSETS